MTCCTKVNKKVFVINEFLPIRVIDPEGSRMCIVSKDPGLFYITQTSSAILTETPPLRAHAPSDSGLRNNFLFIEIKEGIQI